jgi:hypothetical protein
LILIVSGLAFATAAEAAALFLANLAKLPQAGAELVELLADAADLLLDLLDAPIRIAAAGNATLLRLLVGIALLVAGLPGFIFLLPLRAALRAVRKRFLSRLKLAADHDLLAIAFDRELNLVARVHVANLRDKLLCRLDLLAVHFRDAVAFPDPHLLGGRTREDAHDGDSLAAFTDDVHAEAGVLVVAASELPRLLLAILATLLAKLVA